MPTQTVWPVVQFDAHEVTGVGVWIVTFVAEPPSRTILWIFFGAWLTLTICQFAFGTYAVTPSVDTRTDIDPVGSPHDAMACGERQLPATHEAPAAQA